jgi:hypothetical protein
MVTVIVDDTIAEIHSDPLSVISNLESSDTEIVDRNLPATSVWRSMHSCLVDSTDSDLQVWTGGDNEISEQSDTATVATRK